MQSIWSTSAARRLFGTSIAARLPMVMLSIGLIVHAQRLTGSFAAAGLVAAALAVAEGIGGPLLGRLADRRGQTVVLLAGAAVAGSALTAVALLPAGVPAWLLLALATVLGIALPPVAACLRTLLPEVIAGDEAVRRAYAAETTANELTWIAGPPIVLVLGDVLSTGTALLIAGVILVSATAAFALQPASRAWRPAPAGDGPRGGSLRAPAMRALVLVLVAVGVVFGAVEVTVAAAAQMVGSTASAGPLLGIWGAGSVAGGIVAARFGGGARTGTGSGADPGGDGREPPRPGGCRAQRRRHGDLPGARRGDHRPDPCNRLRDGRALGARRHPDRGVCVAEHRLGDRHLDRRRGRGRRNRRRRPRLGVRAGGRRRRGRRSHRRPVRADAAGAQAGDRPALATGRPRRGGALSRDGRFGRAPRHDQAQTPMDEASQPLELLLSVTRDAPTTLGAQIEEQLRRAIREGALHAGARVPSTRDLARQVGVSRRIVVDAYAQLAAEGYLSLRQGARPRVSEAAALVAQAPGPAAAAAPPARFNLRPSIPDVSRFPRSAWLRSLRQALTSMSDATLAYGDVAGVEELRAVLADYLGRVRGVVADPAHVVVTCGYTQGQDLVCRALAARGATRIALESPGDPEQARVAIRAGLEPVPVAVDADGIRVEELARSGADAVIVTPAHQHPTGVVLSGERRAALLAWLREHDAIAIEDDYDAEYRYDRAAIGALQGLEPDRVVYGGSASKTLAPALRLGWLVVPPALLAAVIEGKLLSDRGTARDRADRASPTSSPAASSTAICGECG